ncbi:hypothetical protein BS78_04G133500 [Paspalum vaginatum]|nr:hypothetical protein BS78_04G133500 [Paspalum vaginatum]
MNDEQHAVVSRWGFGAFLDMKIDALECRRLLSWIMDPTSPRDMIIYAGPGKELRITEDVVRLILGLPSSGGFHQEIDSSVKVKDAEKFYEDLEISKDNLDVRYLQERIVEGGIDDLTMQCFFLVLFNCFMFPQASWKLTNRQIALCLDVTKIREVDWS